MDKDGSSNYPPAMPLSLEEIAAAEKMHAFVRRHEKQKFHLVGIIAMQSGLQIEIIVTHTKHPAFFLFSLGALAVGLLFLALMRRLASARYQRDKLLLQVLERDHAAELPWIQTEREEAEVMKHLAAVHEIELEIARGHHAT